MIQHELALLTKVIPESLLPTTFVAGGAAISPQSATDVDVWMMLPGADRQILEDLQQTLTDALYKHGRPRNILLHSLDGPTSLRCPEGLTSAECEKYLLAIRNGWERFGINMFLTYQTFGDAGMPIQILIATAPGVTMMDILDRFDITSQAFATPLDGGASLSLQRSTLPSQMPRVANWFTPQSTLTRLRKLCERYGWDIRTHPDVPRLMELLATQAANRYTREAPGPVPAPALAPTAPSGADDIPF